MITPSFIRWAGRQLHPIMAHTRRRKLSRVPGYSDAAADLEARRRAHRQTRPALARLQNAVTAQLRREVAR